MTDFWQLIVLIFRGSQRDFLCNIGGVYPLGNYGAIESTISGGTIMHSVPSQTDPARRRGAVRTRRLHLVCFAATVAVLAFLGMLRRAELSSGAKPALHRSVMFRFQAETTPDRRLRLVD